MKNLANNAYVSPITAYYWLANRIALVSIVEYVSDEELQRMTAR